MDAAEDQVISRVEAEEAEPGDGIFVTSAVGIGILS